MLDEQTVETMILKALHALNDEMPEDRKFAVGPDTTLFGVDAAIDSLSIVSLIVDLETTLNSEFGLDVALADDRAVSQPVSPFTNVQTLKRYILEIAAESAAP